MSAKTIQRDPIGAAKRKSVAERRVGIGAECACGENRPAALIAGSKPIICEECKRRKNGHNTYDNHHVAGKANHPFTIAIPANDHRELSEAQNDLSEAIRKNPFGSPLLSVAGAIHGLYNTIVRLLKNLLLWIPEYLEKLDACLTSLFGPTWWNSLGLGEIPRRRS